MYRSNIGTCEVLLTFLHVSYRVYHLGLLHGKTATGVSAPYFEKK
jgi:hypothetical protein